MTMDIRLTVNHNDKGILISENGTIAAVRLAEGINHAYFSDTSDMMTPSGVSPVVYGPLLTIPVNQVEVGITDEMGTCWIPLTEVIANGIVEE